MLRALSLRHNAIVGELPASVAALASTLELGVEAATSAPAAAAIALASYSLVQVSVAGAVGLLLALWGIVAPPRCVGGVGGWGGAFVFEDACVCARVACTTRAR